MRLLLTLLLLVVVLPGLPAAAHTDLEATTPEADGVVTDPPVEVVLQFSDPLQAGSEPAVRVVDPAGDDLVAAPPTLDGAVVTVPLNLAVAPGPHVVDWVVTAEDGDDQRGSFTFTFQPPQEVATPPDASPPAAATSEPTSPAASAAPSPTEPAEPAESVTPSSVEPSPSEVVASEDDDSGVPLWLGVAAALAAVAGVLAFAVARGRGADGGP